MEKIVGPTPSGGDYSVIIYLDADGNTVSKQDAVEARIFEYKDDGTLLKTTYGSLR